MTSDYFNNYNRVKPGHINFPRVLRNFRQKTGQVRGLVWHSPAQYATDDYGIPTTVINRQQMEVPDLLAKIQPVTTKDFQLAKEGRWITGAAKIFIPSMEWLFKHYSIGANLDGFQSNYGQGNRIRPWDKEYGQQYPMAIDGLMDNVFYDKEADILDWRYIIEKSGSTNWSATTNYATYFGSDWGLFTSDASNSVTISSDNDSITIVVSGTSNSNTAGTIFFYNSQSWPPLNAANRFSFEYYSPITTDTEKNFNSITPLLCRYAGAASGYDYQYIKYGYTGNTTQGLPTNESNGSTGEWQKYDLPFNSGSVLANTIAAGTGSQITTSVRTGMSSWLRESTDDKGQTFGLAVSAIRDTPNTGTLNGNAAATYPWNILSGSANEYYFGFRLRTSSLAAGKVATIKLRNMKWYRAIPWSVHSVKELADYQVLNCVRDDGQSLNQQVAAAEGVQPL